MNLFVKLGIGISALLITGANAMACTGITLQSQDGAVIRGRTMEFGMDLQSEVIVVPRGYKYIGLTPQKNVSGMKWTSKYAVVGLNFYGSPYLVDGMNEKGLSVGSFYFPQYSKFQEFTPTDANKTMTGWQLNSWLLTNCGSIDDVKKGLKKIRVVSAKYPPVNAFMPLHQLISDSTGKSIVIEYIGGKLHIYDNPIGTLTNAPTFDWHLTNLANYVNITPDNIKEMQFGKMKLLPFGQGSGMLGLPGDFTPPSRFIRAAFYSVFADKQKTALDTVYQAFHILNNFDIPIGVILPNKNSEDNESTEWTSVSDQANLKYYYRSHNNASTRMVDLKKCDLNAKDIIKLTVETPMQVEDVTSKLK